MRDRIDKTLHAGNIAAAFGVVATAAEITFCGGAASLTSAALSGLALFKKADRETKTLAQEMITHLNEALATSGLSRGRRAIAAQMMAAYGPQADDIAKGNNDAGAVAELLRKRAKAEGQDPARLTETALNDFEHLTKKLLDPVLTRYRTTPEALGAATTELLHRSSDAEHERRAEALIKKVQAEATPDIGKNLLITLAYEYTEETTADLDTAYRGVRAALEAGRALAARAALPDNTDAALAAIRKEVAKKNQAGEVDAADAEIDDALERQSAGMVSLLEMGVQQARLRNDPEKAAQRLVELVDLEGSADRFQALRATFITWYENGRDKGLRFDLVVAIALARESLRRATDADQRGNALNDLGTALTILGEREGGTARLEEAVTAYRNALLERTRECVPLDWAMTQNNLGNALQTLGARESDTKRLEEAVTAYRDALLERTRECVPLGWATIQNNLGNALLTLGERESGTKRLEEAVTAYRNALLERTRDRMPLGWAMTLNNLGTALRTLGERESGTKRLEEAVSAYRDALLEVTQDGVPLDWAMTQNNLGTALTTLGERESGTKRLEEAATAYLEALLERTRDRVPLDWASTRSNQARLALAFFDKTGEAQHLDDAQVHLEAALAVFTEAGATQYIAMAEKLQAMIDTRRG